MDKKYQEKHPQAFTVRLKQSIFTTYCFLLKQQSEQDLIYYLGTAIHFLQVNLLLIFPATMNSESTLHTSVSGLANFSKILTIFQLSPNFNSSRAILYLYFCLIILQILMFVYFYFIFNIKITQETFIMKKILAFFLNLNIFFRTILTIPITTIFLSFFQCSSGNLINYTNEVCDDKYYYTHIALGSFSLFFFLILTILNNLFLNDDRPVSKLGFSGTPIEINFLYTLLNISLSIFYTFNLGSKMFFVKMFFMVVLTSFILLIRILNPVYQRRSTFYVNIFAEASFFFFAVFSLIDYTSSISYNYGIFASELFCSLIFGLFFVFLINLVVNLKIKKIVLNNPDEKPHELNIMLRLLIEDIKEFRSDSTKRLFLLDLLNIHRQTCEVESCLCSEHMIQLEKIVYLTYNSSELSLISKDDCKYIKEYYENPEKATKLCLNKIIILILDLFKTKLQKNVDFIIIYSYFMTYYHKNIFKALFEMMQIGTKLSITNEFRICFLNFQIEIIMHDTYLNHKNDNIDIEQTLKFNSISFRILEKMDDTASIALEFWTDVKGGSIRSKIYDASVKIAKNVHYLKNSFIELISQKNFQNIKLLFLYVDFLEKIVFYEHESVEIREKLSTLIQNIDFTVTENIESTSFILNNEDVGSVVISGNLSELGIVLTVNFHFCNIFKFQKNDIIGSQINKIIPYYIAQYHDSFLKRYFSTAKKHVLDLDRIVFGLNSLGFIFAIVIHAKIIPNLEKSIRFIALTKKLEKTHSFMKARNAGNHQISFMLLTLEDHVFGITKKACIDYGIPLNVLLNNKINTDQVKTLNINYLIPDFSTITEEKKEKLFSEEGLKMKINSKFLKDFFEDFRETCMGGTSVEILDIFKYNFREKFKEHNVHVYMSQLGINDNTIQIRILKVVNLGDDFTGVSKKLKPSKAKSSKIGFYEDFSKLVLTESYVINEDKEKNKKEEERLLIKQDINNSKKELLQMKYPKNIKIFIVISILILFFAFLLSLIEFLLKMYKLSDTSLFFKVYSEYLLKNLYLTYTLIDLNTLVLIDNSLINSSLYNKTEYDLLRLKTQFGVSKLFNYSNFLGVDLQQVPLISDIYTSFNIDINQLGLKTSTKNKYSYFSNEVIVEIKNLMILRNLSFFNKSNSQIFDYSVENIKSRNFYFINNNTLGNYRTITEQINSEILSLLTDTRNNILSLNTINIVNFIAIIVCILGFILFILILNQLTSYKIKILKIFFLIDKSCAENIIRRCKKYLSNAQSFLLSKNRGSLFFFQENDDNRPSKLESIPEEKEKDKELNSEIMSDKENEELSKITILVKQFRKVSLMNYLKVFLMISVILIYFLISILRNSFYNTISNEIIDIQMVFNRGSIFFNMILYYRQMLIDNIPIQKLNSSANLTSHNLNSNQLFKLYYQNLMNIESSIISYSGRQITLLNDYYTQEGLLDSNQFCSVLNLTNPDYYRNFQNDCFTTQNSTNLNGMTNSILAISNYFLNSFFKLGNTTNPNFAYELLNDMNLKLIIGKSSFFLGSALEILINSVFKDISNSISSNLYFSEFQIISLAIVIITELAIYLIFSQTLKGMINKDKAILTIIPSEAISNNSKVKTAFQELNI